MHVMHYHQLSATSINTRPPCSLVSRTHQPTRESSTAEARQTCLPSAFPPPTTLYLTVCFGSATIDTTVTRDVRASALLCGRRLIVGLSCEWKPNRSPWTTSKVAILQLCDGARCLVFQLCYAAFIPASLRRRFFADPWVRFVGVDVGENVAKLYAEYGFACAAAVDLEGLCDQYLGRVGGGRRLGLKGFAREVLGVVMDKPYHVTMSNWDWEKDDLDTCQIQYACIDAYVSYKLGEKVLAN